MISKSQEVQEWNLDIKLEPDEIEGKVLKRPSIFIGPNTSSPKVLDDTNILRTIVS